MTLAALLADRGAELTPERVRADPLEVALYARDASMIEGRAAAVCFPTTTEEGQAAVCVPATTAEVQAAVRGARAHGRAVIPRGSGTGLAGGAVPVSADGVDPVV